MNEIYVKCLNLNFWILIDQLTCYDYDEIQKNAKKTNFFCMIFLLFLIDFSTNISNKLFIIKYDLRYCFWCSNNDVCEKFDENVAEAADIDLNVIETNTNLEKRDDFVIIFEFVVIVFFDVFDIMKDVINKSISLFFSSTKRCFNVSISCVLL